MDLFLGLLVLSGLITLFQLLLPGKSGRGIGIAQWLTWIALATAAVAFLGSGRAEETFNRITGNFVQPAPSSTISPIPVESSPTTLNPSLAPPTQTPAPDGRTSFIAIEGWNQATESIRVFLSQIPPTPAPAPSPSPSPNLVPSPSPSPSPSLTPAPVPSPSPNSTPPIPPPSPIPQAPINGLW